jgi:hypothetical protein
MLSATDGFGVWLSAKAPLERGRAFSSLTGSKPLVVGFLTENGFLNGGILWEYELSYRVKYATERNVNITSVELKEMLMQEWAGCLFDVRA